MTATNAPQACASLNRFAPLRSVSDQKPDYEQIDADVTPYLARLLGRVAAYFWVDHAMCEVHSDALFVDAAQPRLTRELPPDFCAITARKQAGTTSNPGPGGGTTKTSN